MKTAPFVKLRSLAFALTLLASVQARGETYYLSPSGSDRQEGTSPQKAWQTISRANKASAPAGR